VQFSSRLIEEAVDQMASLPGVGKKTALRLVLHLLKREDDEVARFSRAFVKLKEEIKACQTCFNLSDSAQCEICSNPLRNLSTVCVVEGIRELMAIEGTDQYRGGYHILGGVISPMDGVGPSDLNVEGLLDRVRKGEVTEIIFALSTTMEGETTAFYLYKKLASFDVQVTAIARGVAVGDELQYADEVTLARSIQQRLPYENLAKRG